MKNIKQYISEQISSKFPMQLHDIETEDDAEDLQLDLEQLFSSTNSKSIVVYECDKRASAKRMTGLTFYDCLDTVDDLYDFLIKHNGYGGFVITLEDDYTFGVSYRISGPLPTPLYYFRFANLEKIEIEEDEIDVYDMKYFNKISNKL